MARREEKNTTQRRPEDWFPSVRAPGTASTDDLSGKVDTTTEVIAGAGLTDGGDLSANVTLNVGAGTGITVNANDVAIDTTAEAERIRDTIGTALVAGSNVTITVNDPGDTITIDASTGTSYTDEQAQDAVGTILTDTATIDFTYNDAGNQITADVKAGSIGATEIAATAVTPGSYINTNLTVDADGRITAAANGSSTPIAQGTSFPGSPTTGDFFYRTDRMIEYVYDGTRWLSTQIFTAPMVGGSSEYAKTTTAISGLRCPNMWAGVYDIYVLHATFSWNITSSASWTLSLSTEDVTTVTNLCTLTPTWADTNWHSQIVTVNSVVSNSVDAFFGGATKNTGTATINFLVGMAYRLVG